MNDPRTARDPFEQLRAPVRPVDPDPTFAAGLRDRLERALLTNRSTPRGDPMSTTESTENTEATEPTEPTRATEAPDVQGLPPDFPAELAADLVAEAADPRLMAWGPTLQPMLTVHAGREAYDWYVAVFEAEPRGEPYATAEGRIVHAELAIGDAVLMLADEDPAYPNGPRSPRSGAAGAAIFVSVEDVDATIERAVEHGAEVTAPANEQYYGRTGSIRDPFGHHWTINTRPARASTAHAGDVVYLTYWDEDDERADETERFYTAVLGTRVAARSTDPTLRFASRTRFPAPDGLPPGPGSHPLFRVARLDTAIARVRAAGGRAAEPETQSYGRTADCVDPQGRPFGLWEPANA